MNAPLSKEQLARLMDVNLAYRGQYVPELNAPVALPGREGRKIALLGRLGAIRTWMSAHRERRAVMNELAQLSDRDLADIGLSRGQLHRVFDPEFARNHGLEA